MSGTSPECDLFTSLLPAWLTEVGQEWKRLRAKRAIPLNVSWMVEADERNFRSVRLAVMRWTVAWFRERGVDVRIEEHADREQFRPVPQMEGRSSADD